MDVVFPKLVKFTLCYCNQLKEWEDIQEEEVDTITVMPKLESLEIRFCDKLEVLPSGLLFKAPRLKKLEIISSNDLLRKRIRDDQLKLHIDKIIWIESRG
ncbi:hypothetical protein LIER_39929 [Lithospermum erythrorhizon]|uniref:Uncharacterized protein n=1 Tax=Lithospermum erythrorhizon TaxID=34254 RepID=A0AAV3QQ25_LITER